MVERRQCLHLASVGLLAPTERRGRLQHTLQVQFA
jgi:hypothetical protein